MKIIIIGAGIAGLTLANACSQAGFEVCLYEKTSVLKNIGGGILLWPHGLRYLQWLGLEHLVAPYSIPITSTLMQDPEGKILTELKLESVYQRLDGEILPIDRHSLQQQLANHLASNILRLGKQAIAIENKPNHATVTFADGSKDKADVIICANGIYSNLRTPLLGSNVPDYTGYVWWGGVINADKIPHLSRDKVLFSLFPGKAMILWPLQGDQFMWYLPVKMPLGNYHQHHSFEQLQQQCKDWNNPIIHDIIAAAQHDKQFYLPIHALTPQQKFVSDRTAFIGDAIHGIGPLLGQGASLGIEDAVVLFHQLKAHPHHIPQALLNYQQARREKCHRLWELEEQSAASMLDHNEDSLSIFMEQLKQADLLTLYADLIPLVDLAACKAAIKTDSVVMTG